MASLDFSNDSELSKGLSAWWRQLDQDRGVRAELRRAQNEGEVIILRTLHIAGRRFAKFFPNRWEKFRLAMILGLLSHVKQTTNLKIGIQMATGSRPKVSELRFKRLLRCERDELYQPLVQVIRLLDGQVNIGGFAELCFYWGDNMRRKLAFDYYGQLGG